MLNLNHHFCLPVSVTYKQVPSRDFKLSGITVKGTKYLFPEALITKWLD